MCKETKARIYSRDFGVIAFKQSMTSAKNGVKSWNAPVRISIKLGFENFATICVDSATEDKLVMTGHEDVD